MAKDGWIQRHDFLRFACTTELLKVEFQDRVFQKVQVDDKKDDRGSKKDSKKVGRLYSQQAKAIEPLNAFCFAIEKRNLSKYSCALTKKGEREKKTMLVYRGRFALLASFYLHFILKQAA